MRMTGWARRSRWGVSLVVCAGFVGCGGGGGPGRDAAPAGDGGADAGLDAAPGLDGGPSDGGSPTEELLLHCESLFAARIVELQIELAPDFPEDCDAPLEDEVGTLAGRGGMLCRVGESANACRTRLYETPPALTSLDPGCSGGSGESCLTGQWIPRCADGTDACEEPEAVCQDGTRPLAFFQAATSGASNRWIIHLGGEGGPCNGARCWFNYRFAAEVDDLEFEQAMSSIHPDHGGRAAAVGGGVTAGLVDPANPFAALNRVRFERCTDAASTAIESVPVGNGVPAAYAEFIPPGAPVSVETRVSRVPVWHHGFDTWRALLRSLATDEGRNLDGDPELELPSIADAEQVLLAGSSDASAWVVFAGDRLAEELRAIAGPDVDVRILIDGLFEPGLDSAGRYHADAPADFDLFTHPYAETGLCHLADNGDGADNEACSDTQYRTGPGLDGRPTLHDGFDARGVVMDESCVAMHGPGAPQCYDKIHVLLHHLATPVLVLADQEDYTIRGAGAPFSDGAQHHEYTDRADFRMRVLDQAHDVERSWSTAAREEGPGVPGRMVLLMPKSARESEPWRTARHVRFHDNVEMLRVMSACSPAGALVGSTSFARGIELWATDALPRNFVIEDAAAWDGTSAYFVTGANCMSHE